MTTAVIARVFLSPWKLNITGLAEVGFSIIKSRHVTAVRQRSSIECIKMDRKLVTSTSATTMSLGAAPQLVADQQLRRLSATLTSSAVSQTNTNTTTTGAAAATATNNNTGSATVLAGGGLTAAAVLMNSSSSTANNDPRARRSSSTGPSGTPPASPICSSMTSSLTTCEPGTEPESVLVAMIRQLLPELRSDRHKGDAGRIGVLGGCREYTGAPYFAAISALKMGCDLSHVFCTSEAAPVIKSYSPELIVHPVLDNRNAVDEIGQWLPRLHALIVGPGLGRDDKMYYHVKDVIQIAQKLDIPIVIDADGLFFVTQYPEVIKGSKKLILTPNAVEFARLYRKLVGSDLPSKDEENELMSVTRVGELLGNVTVVRKGERDIIGDGLKYLVCDHPGSPRRCGGQGDLLSGSMGAFAYWSSMAAATINDASSNYSNPLLGEYGSSMCAAYAACWLTRECNRLAFSDFRRSTTTTDMIANIGRVVRALEADDDDDDDDDDDGGDNDDALDRFPLISV